MGIVGYFDEGAPGSGAAPHPPITEGTIKVLRVYYDTVAKSSYANVRTSRTLSRRKSPSHVMIRNSRMLIRPPELMANEIKRFRAGAGTPPHVGPPEGFEFQICYPLPLVAQTRSQRSFSFSRLKT
eukprot:1187081-Prorocentrum_minimum.AAC.11